MAQRIAVLLLALLTLVSCVSRTGSGPGSPEGGPSGVGRDRLEQADPCAFLDNENVTGLGETEFEDGFFYTDCTAVIAADANTVRIRAQLQLEVTDSGEWREETRDGFTVHVGTEQSYGCEREIEVHDDVVVAIWAYQIEDGGSICDTADTATDAAIEVLRGGEIRQLEVEADSLANQNACALLEEDDVASAPGVDGDDVHPAFGGQSCDWGGALISEPGVYVGFSRQDPPTVSEPGDEVVEIAGRSGVRSTSEADEFGDSLPSCEVELVYENDIGHAEVLTVTVRGEGDPVGSCPLVDELAEKALDRLPG